MRWLNLFLVAAVVALAAVSCDDDFTKPSDGQHELAGPTSPEAALDSLQARYGRMDIGAYAALLDPDFVFIPTAGEDLAFVHLDREADSLSTQAMFAEADGITLELTFGESEESDLSLYPASEGYRMITASNVLLRVSTTLEGTGEPIIWLVNGDEAFFVLRPDSSSTPVIWTIVLQKDLHVARLGTSNVHDMSWSEIKGMYMTGGPPAGAASPEAALDSVVAGYGRMDIETYAEVIDLDFAFEPSEYDDLDFDQLNRSQDHRSTWLMFERVEQIVIHLTHGGSEESNLPAYPGSEGYRMISVPDVFLAVLTRDENTGKPVTLLVDGDEALFVFRPDNRANPTSWTIVYQKDLHVPNLVRSSVENCSWGIIKGYFR